ncbi:MAG: autotransporter domain-containing protein, partial [Alphaproteobacteria bacterium]|nr:autotransporter domain-containing protein [Alphaproteobacteria bacterium]
PGGLTGSDEVTVTVSDLAPAFGDAAVGSLVLVLDEAMDPVVLPEATGGNGALTYGLTSAPTGLAGLGFDVAARRLSGTPGTEGSYVFTWRADDADSNRADTDAAILTFRVTVEDARTAAVKRSVRRTLAAVARRALTSALDNIGARFAASVPMSGLTLAGETVPLGVSGAGAGTRLAGAERTCPAGAPGRHGLESAFGQTGFGAGCAASARSRGVEVADLMWSSAFSLNLGAAGGSGTPSAALWSVWGRGDLGTFAGHPEGMRYEGELRTGWLGMDARAGPWVAGFAVSHGTGEADYSFDSDGYSGEGRLETELTAVYPYGRWTLSDGLELRGVVGAGWGEAQHWLDGEERETSDLAMWMGSLGVRHELPALAGIDLAARSDASLARMETEDGPDHVDNLTADSWRVRAGVEASRRIALDGETALTPFVEAAAREDGGDGLTGTGLEIAGGLRYTAPRLHVEARGRWLAAHSQEGAEERGVSVTARVGPGAHGRGLSLMLSPRLGAGTGAAQALWR